MPKFVAPVCLVLLILPAASTWAQPSEPAPPQAAKKFMLPAPVDQVVRAGSGDVLLLKLDKLATLAVFDIKAAKIVGYVPLEDSDTLVAGTADSVILLARGTKVIQRWSLDPLEKKLTVALPLTEKVDDVAAGYAGNAPMLIMTRQGPRFLDTTTLRLLETSSANDLAHWSPNPEHSIQVTTSADGSTFAGWATGVSPSGIRTLRLEGSRLIEKYAHDSAGMIIPSHDGSLLFTSSGVFSADLMPLDRDKRGGGQTVPTLHPAYYLAVSRGSLRGNRQELSLSVFSTCDRMLLVTLDDVPGLGAADPFRGGGTIPIHDRIIAHPGANRLLVVDETRTAMHILPLDVIEALNAKGIDYLFVESLPITMATRGKTYEYAIKVLSKAGDVSFTLDHGPKGMALSRDGVLTWDVPNDFDHARTSVITTIADGSGQSLFHAYLVHLAVKPKAASQDKTDAEAASQ